MAPSHAQLTEGDALLVVDVQPDFCPGGALAVPDGEVVIPVLNLWIESATRLGLPIYASRDFHPPHHVSFAERGGPWPPHCVQDTAGAAYHPDLALPDDAVRVAKGVRLDHDQTSAFDETGLAADLRRRGVRRVWVGGLAEDVCVKDSVVAGAGAGFEMHLIRAATRPVDPARADAVEAEMVAAGAVLEDDP